jgi:hypothetical protein
VGFFVMLGSGCGGVTNRPKPVAAEGVLTFEDGKPVAEATIVFLPDDTKSPKASGLTGKDGSFSLTTYNQNDGAVPGDYKIIVTKSNFVEDAPKEGGDRIKRMKEYFEKSKQPKEKGVVPAVYGNPKTSPLKWRVESGGTKINLKLKTL